MDDLGGVVAGDGVFQQVHETERERHAASRTFAAGDVGIRVGFSGGVWRSVAGASDYFSPCEFVVVVRDGDDSRFAFRGVGAADSWKQLERDGDHQDQPSIDSARAVPVDSPSYIHGNAGGVAGDGDDTGTAKRDNWIFVGAAGTFSEGAAGRIVFVAGVW